MDVALPAAAGAHRARPYHRARVRVGAVVAAVLALVSAVVALEGAPQQPALVAVVRALITAVPMGVGLYAWSRRLHPRYGLLLYAAGALWCVSSLAESDASGAYTVGRLAGWFAVVMFVVLILAYPSGRLRTRTDRTIALAMLAVVVVLYLPRLLIAESFELPSPYTSCTESCPANTLFVLDAEPAWVQSVMRPLGTLGAVVVITATVIRLHRRHARASPLARRMLSPVVGVSALFGVLLAGSLAARQAGAPQGTLVTLTGALALTVPVLALAVLLGLLRGKLFVANALTRIATCLEGRPDAEGLRRAFADALHDPDVVIAFPAGRASEWVDGQGRPLDGQGPDASTDIRRDGRLIAAVRHDPALLDEPELLAACTALAGVALDNERLDAESEAALRELARSRARIAATAEQERQRIERDLHDGAQQRLVAMRIELGLTEDLLRSDPNQAIERLHLLEQEIEQALEDLRSLAHGVYPPILADRGLVEALQAVAARSTIPVALDAHDVRRHSPEVESAVYFCVLEALQNVLKHAATATRVQVRIEEAGGTVRFAVRDDGDGAPGGELRAGAGLTNMRDRLEAVGGTLAITSTERVGTVVEGRVPAAERGPA